MATVRGGQLSLSVMHGCSLIEEGPLAHTVMFTPVLLTHSHLYSHHMGAVMESACHRLSGYGLTLQNDLVLIEESVKMCRI